MVDPFLTDSTRKGLEFFWCHKTDVAELEQRSVIQEFQHTPTDPISLLSSAHPLTSNAKEMHRQLAHLTRGQPLPKKRITLLDLLASFGPQKILPLYAILLQRMLLALKPELERVNNVTDPLKKEPLEQSLKIKINALLSYLAYAECQTGEHYTVPVCIQGRWKMQQYVAEKIPLTHTVFGPRYSCYGLTPVDNPSAPSQLLFMGTCTAGFRGYLWTLLSDSFPGLSVGRLMFKIGQKKINKWIAKQPGKVLCHGQSLGGCMTVHTAMAHPEKVTGYANVPAGLIRPKQTDANIEIYSRGSDPISAVGHMPRGPNISYFYELPPAQKSGHAAWKTGLSAHSYSHRSSFGFSKGSTVLRVQADFFDKAKHGLFFQALLKVLWVIGPIIFIIGKILSLPVHLIKAALRVQGRKKILVEALTTPEIQKNNIDLLYGAGYCQAFAMDRNRKLDPSNDSTSPSQQAPKAARWQQRSNA